MKAGRRISLALALSLILFLPVAHADNPITLTSPNAAFFGLFGYSVAVSEGGAIVVVGAIFEDTGHAHVLDTATGLITTLTSPTPVTTGEFGYSVAVSGTTVVVGAPDESAGNPVKLGAGHAHVFDVSIIVPTSITLASADPQPAGHFGWSVAVSGTTVVVGAPDESGGGHAYVFDVSTSVPTSTTLMSSNPLASGKFGNSVAVSGTTVVVGAPDESAGNPLKVKAGNAYVFDATIGFPTPTTTLTSPYAQDNGQFGWSVAVGGTAVVVGARGETAGLVTAAGHAYSYDTSTHFLTTTLTSANPQLGGGNFGYSVSVTGIDPIVVVGAPVENGGSTAEGHAYVFF